MVATVVIHVITWIATHLLTPEGWKAELAWTSRTFCPQSGHQSTIDQVQDGVSRPAKDRRPNQSATTSTYFCICCKTWKFIGTEGADVQPRPQPKPAPTDFDLHPYSLVCRFNGSRPCNPCIHGLLLNFQPQRDGRLSWLTHSGQFTHIVVTSQSAIYWTQERESSPAKDRRPNHWATPQSYLLTYFIYLLT